MNSESAFLTAVRLQLAYKIYVGNLSPGDTGGAFFIIAYDSICVVSGLQLSINVTFSDISATWLQYLAEPLNDWT